MGLNAPKLLMAGYFLVTPPQPGPLTRTDGASLPYCGMDRDEWGALWDLVYCDRPVRGVKEALNRFRTHYYGPLSFGTAASAAEVFALRAAFLGPDHLSDVLKVALLGEASIQITPEESLTYLGIDWFADGFGSPLLQGIHFRPDVFRDRGIQLNEFGLFENAQDADHYRAVYLSIMHDADLEIFDPDSNLQAYRVWRVDSVAHF